MSALDWQPFAARTKALMNRYAAPGLSAGLARRGRPPLFRNFGCRDREATLPVNEDTVFGIGSLTKSFTALLIMQLEEEGRLSVDDPVVKYLPEFRIKDKAGTAGMLIRHFLTHSSGLPPLPSLTFCMLHSMRGDPVFSARLAKSEALTGHPGIQTATELMDFIAGLDFQLLAPPGAQFSYSNDAFGLLGTIIERTTGQPYARAVAERVFGPLGMTRSGLDIGALQAAGNVTTLYTRPGEQGKEPVTAAPVWQESPAMQAAGFIRSTARDLLRYAEVYRSGGRANGFRILSGRGVGRMMTPYVESGVGTYYGFGLGVRPGYHGVTLVEHGGAIKGIAAHVSVVPEAGLAAVALANLDGVPSGEVTLAALNTALGLPAETGRLPRQGYAYPAWHLERLAGRYTSQEGLGNEVRVEVTDGRARVHAQGLTFEPSFIGPYSCVVRRFPEDEGNAARALLTPRGEVWALLTGSRVMVRQAEPAAQAAASPEGAAAGPRTS